MKPRLDEPTIPAVHALHLVELVQRWDVSAAALLRGTGLDEPALRDPGTKLGLSTLIALVARARALTGEHGLGIYYGLRMQVAWHGYLGFAAMTAPTVGAAIELATRFAPTLTRVVSFRLETGARRAALVVEEGADLGTARDVVIFALLVGLWRIGCTLTGRELPGVADVAFDEPDYFARFRPYAPGLRFGARSNRLVFPAATLDSPIGTADPAALQLARGECERALERLGFDGGIVERVRAALPRPDGGFRALDGIARALGVSQRTLKRNLAASSTSYSALLDAARLARARDLLASPGVTVDGVADALGYSDTANFTRAFRRWTGTTPAAYRQSLRAASR